jgi:hypothetical protein
VWSLDAEGDAVRVGTNRGLFRIEGERAVAVPLPEFAEPPAVRALAHAGGALYVGTDRGLLVRPAAGGPGRLLTRAQGLPADEILDLEPDRRGRLWIATSGGIALLEGGLLSRVRDYDRLGAGQPLALHADADGALWVIAGAGGLARIRGGEAAALGAEGGLLDDNLYAIAEDGEERLWLGTSSGILRVARADLEARLRDRRRPLPQTLFGRFDGVDPGGIAAFGKRAVLGADGRLHFATFGGVAVAAPERPGPADAAPQAIIERIEVDGVPAPFSKDGPLALPGSHRQLAFDLAAPLPHAGSKVSLRYRLAGFDSRWVEAGPERRAAYAGLVPGIYRFEVQASNTEGAWLTAPASLSFEVEAGFLQSWRLPALLLVGVAAATWLFHRWRSHQILARQRELDSRIDQAMADIRVLHGLLPFCGTCLKVRDDQGYWQQIETYLAESTALEFTHGYCPDCAKAVIAQLDQDPAPAR